MRIVLTLGLLLALAGCLSLYLGSAHQRLAARTWPSLFTRVVGVLLLVGGLSAMFQDLQPVAALFVFGTWLMACFLTLPYLGALKTLWGDRR